MCFATEGGGIVEFEDDAMAMAIVGDGEDEDVDFYKLLNSA